MHAFCMFYVAGKLEHELTEQLLVNLLPESEYNHSDGPLESFSWLYHADF